MDMCIFSSKVALRFPGILNIDIFGTSRASCRLLIPWTCGVGTFHVFLDSLFLTAKKTLLKKHPHLRQSREHHTSPSPREDYFFLNSKALLCPEANLSN